LGAKVTVYCRKKFNYPDESYVSENFIIKRIVTGGGKFIPKEKLGPHIDEFAIKVAQDLKKTPSVVHGHYWDGGKAALLLAKHMEAPFPIIWTPHSLGTVKRRNFTGLANELKYNFTGRVAWETYAMLYSDFLIVSSDDEKQRIALDYAIGKQKIKIIPPGIQPFDFIGINKKESRTILGLPQNKFVLMSLGRLDRRKGYHNSISAFAELQKNLKPNAVLAIFAGSSNSRRFEEREYAEELRQMAVKSGLVNKIIFRPAIAHDQVRYIYGASDVYLCLSEYEPFGITILESMASGVPVIATDNGGPRNIIKNNYNGILVRPTDYERTAFAIAKFEKGNSFTRAVVENAKREVGEKYTWEARAKRFYEIYERISKNFSKEKRRFIEKIDIP
jgi:sucrose-phosphate synthase